MIDGDVPFYAKIWRILTQPLQNADFQSIFARSASAVTSNKKVKGWLKNAKCLKFEQ